MKKAIIAGVPGFVAAFAAIAARIFTLWLSVPVGCVGFIAYREQIFNPMEQRYGAG